MKLKELKKFEKPLTYAGYRFIGKYKGHVVVLKDKVSERNFDKLVYFLLDRFPGDRILLIVNDYDEKLKEDARKLGIKIFRKGETINVEIERGLDEYEDLLFGMRIGYFALKRFQRVSPNLSEILDSVKQHYLMLGKLGKTGEASVKIEWQNPPREHWPLAGMFIDNMIRGILENLGFKHMKTGHGSNFLEYEFMHEDTMPKAGKAVEDDVKNTIIRDPPKGWIIKKRLIRKIENTGKTIFYEKWVHPKSKTLLIITSTPFEYEATMSIGVYDPEKDEIVSDLAPLSVVKKRIPENERTLDENLRGSFIDFVEEVKNEMRKVESLELGKPARWEFKQHKSRRDVIDV